METPRKSALDSVGVDDAQHDLLDKTWDWLLTAEGPIASSDDGNSRPSKTQNHEPYFEFG